VIADSLTEVSWLVVAQFGLRSSQLPLRHAFYYADSTTFQIAGAHLALRRSRARLN
jgi:hypothetical protein